MVKRKCAYCDETTSRALSDFWSTGWEAVSFNNRKDGGARWMKKDF